VHTVAKANTRIIRLQGGGLRFLDADEIQVVTRPFQGFDTAQHWRITDTGNGNTIEQLSSGRFLDAQEIGELDFRAVTRPRQDTESQLWHIEDFGGGFITVQQVSSGRFLEATLDGDFDVVARPLGSTEQTWRIGDP
jgi:hypothetical protein